MKLVLNKRHGGFALSTEAVELYEKYSGKEYNWVYIDRADKDLVKVVEELGSERSSGCFSKLKVVEIPNDSYYVLSDYDGMETIYYSESKIYKV